MRWVLIKLLFAQRSTFKELPSWGKKPTKLHYKHQNGNPTRPRIDGYLKTTRVIRLSGLTFRRPSRGTSRANTSSRRWQSYHESFPAAGPAPQTAPNAGTLQHPFAPCLATSRASHALRGEKPRPAASKSPAATPSRFRFVLKKYFFFPPSRKAYTTLSRD